MDNLVADFTININEPLQAEFVLGNSQTFDCSFELFAAGTVWGSIDGDITNQTDLQEALNLKADKVDLDADVELINQTINENYNDLSGQIEDLETVVADNYTALENDLTSLSSTVDNNYSELSNRLLNDEQTTSDLIETVADNYTELNGKISTNTGNITSIQNTINSYGDIVSYNATDFATAAQGILANTALQPGDNITELVNNAGYITSADLPTLEDLTTQAQMDAINSGATSVNIAQIASNTQAISTETLNRQNADNGLQSQIDAIVASSDVFDIVGTYAELQAYDISTVPPNDIIKVLVDSTHNNAATYYRCVETNSVKSWSYIGSEGAYYTKSEADGRFVPLTRTINGKALSNNITLDATDVGALPSSTVIPTVNDGTLTIQVNGTSVGTFTANQSGNTTANIVVPDSATWGNITGTLSNQTDLQNALNSKADSSSIGNGTVTFTQGGVTKGTITMNQSGNTTIAFEQGGGSGTVTDVEVNGESVVTDGVAEIDLTGYQVELTAGTDLEIIEGSTLPASYVQLKSITSTTTQYINTKISMTANYKAVIVGRLTQQPSSNFTTILGADNLSKTGAQGRYNVILGWGNATNGFYTENCIQSGATVDYTYSSYPWDTETHTFTITVTPTQTTLNIDGTINTISLPPAVWDVPTPLYLFARNLAASGSIGNRTPFELEKIEQYQDGVLVFNGIPCKFGDIVGLYNTVTDEFLPNSGTGAFVEGDVIPSETVINFTNDSGYITGINSSDVITALGYTPVNPSSLATVATSGDYDDLTNKPTIPTVGDGTITITQGGVTKGTFTTNQSGNSTIALDAGGSGGSYSAGTGIDITNDTISIDTSVVAQLSDIPTNYVTTDTAQNISGRKTFLGEKAIYFKQSATTDKLGFTLYNPSDTELGAFEWRPSTISGGALLNINVPYSSSNYVGFRYWGTAVNIIAPKVATAGNYYIPTHITDGNTTVTANSTGTVNISSLLPNVSGYLENTATGSNSLSIFGSDATYNDAINIGYNSNAIGYHSVTIGCESYDAYYPEAGNFSVAIGNGAIAETNSVAIGYDAQCYYNTNNSIAIGNQASVSESGNNTTTYAIQLGEGTNTTSNTMQVWNYSLLNKTTGLIPDARLSSNIARTSQIPTVPTNISAFTNDSGYVTSSALSGYATQTWVGQQGFITSASLPTMTYTSATETLTFG